MQKTLLWVGGGLVVLFLATLLFGPRLAEQRVRAALDAIPASETDSLGYTGLDVSLWQRRLRLDSIYLDLPIPRKGDSLRARGRIAGLDLSGIGLWPLLRSGSLRANLLRIAQPDLYLYYGAPPPDSLRKSPGSGSVFIAEYQIVNAAVAYENAAGERKLAAFRTDAAAFLTRKDTTSSLDQVTLRVDSLIVPAQRSDYIFSDLRLDGSEGTAQLARLTSRPHQSQAAYDRNPRTNSWLALRFDSLSLTGANILAALRGAPLQVRRLGIGRLDVRAYENKNHRTTGSRGTKLLPGPRLNAISFPFHIDSLELAAGHIKYGIMTTTNELGEIDFHRTRAWAQNITNIDSLQARRPRLPVLIKARFMNQAAMEARFAFTLNSSSGAFTMDGQLSDYALPDINPMLLPAANVKVEEGHLQSLSYRAEADQNLTQGSMELRYDNLKVDLAKGHPWYAYLFKGVVLKKENPHNGEFRPGNIYHEHDRTKSFFNLYWNALVSGMKSTALGDVALPEPLQ